jgi:TonB family protein
VPLEHFKTQVLLLHSQQSTLDALSTGFGDRYAVHVATSGAEALTTLGETPIHVIVSAQDLPGMSGLEALREAKKRSPDTIGILLAGSARDDGLEALVSDKEVFQIVRGAVTPDTLMQLIDQATKRVRLLTIAESANDHAADVDEPAGEHIVMETSENGATIISDGTGRMRALKPQKVQLASHVGGRDVDVLVLTKDEEFLATIRESSRGLHNVHPANTLAQAEAIARNHKVGILVTDAAMIGSDIESIAARLRAEVPRLVAIVAGRRDDGELLMELINRGHVYRFLLKPVSPGRARLAIEASVKHHLEAADSAFRNKASGEAPATPRPAAAQAAKPQAQKPQPQPQKPKAQKPAEAKRSDKSVEPVIRPTETNKPAPGKAPEEQAPAAQEVDRLDSAFGESGRLTRTMNGIAASAGQSVSAASDSMAKFARVLLQPKLLAIGATAIVALVAIGWWLTRPEIPAVDPADVAEVEESVPASTPESTPTFGETAIPLQDPPATPSGLPADPASTAPPYQALLEEARIAREAGEIVAPAGSSALELYIAALELATDEPVLRDELGQTVDDAIGIIEQALLEQRGDDAAVALRMVQSADPDNPRLAFLGAQVTQLELRTRIESARAAIREVRIEDAARAIAAARSLAGTDTAEIDALSQELARVRSEQRVDDVLALAGQRLAENALTAPDNDNARYYYDLALSNDPGNTTAQQGIAIVAGKLVLRAREAIDGGRLDDAERILQDAGDLDAGSSELASSIVALANARAAQEEAERQAQAEQQAAAERVASSDDSASMAGAVFEPASIGGLSPAAPGAGGTARAARDELAEQPLTAARRKADPVADPDEAVSSTQRTAGERGPGTSHDSGNDSSRSEPGAAGFVAISSLERTNYVAPRYPRMAQRRGITGWVDISFTVTTDGSVTGIEVMNSDPADIFDDSASNAVSEWRFEPPMQNGMPVERRVAVRMMFNLE